MKIPPNSREIHWLRQPREFKQIVEELSRLDQKASRYFFKLQPSVPKTSQRKLSGRATWETPAV